VGENREHDVPGLFLGGLSPEVIDGQLPPKMVESTAHVVDRVSNDQAPVIADLGQALSDPKDQVVTRIELPPRTENTRRCLPAA